MTLLFFVLTCLGTCGGFFAGYYTGNKKRHMTEKELLLYEMSRCEIIKSMKVSVGRGSTSVTERCELGLCHVGPHKVTVKPPYINAGEIIWWNDPPELPPVNPGIKLLSQFLDKGKK